MPGILIPTADSIMEVRPKLVQDRPSNGIVTIHHLTPKALSEIFQHVRGMNDPNDDFSWMAVAQVCRYWREVALKTPELWRRLTLHQHIDPNDAEKLLSRSLDGKLTLTIGPAHMALWYLTEILPSLERHGRRCVSVSVTHMQDLRPYLLRTILSRCFPNLQRLTLSVSVDSYVAHLTVATPCLGRLTSLTLDCAVVRFEGVLPALERLELIDRPSARTSRKWDPDLFRSLIIACPHLRILVVRRSTPDTQHFWPNCRTETLLPLRHLRELRVDDDSQEVHALCSQLGLFPFQYVSFDLNLDHRPYRRAGPDGHGSRTWEDLVQSSEMVEKAVQSSGGLSIVCDSSLSAVLIGGDWSQSMSADPASRNARWEVRLHGGGPHWYARTVHNVLSTIPRRTLLSPNLAIVDLHIRPPGQVHGTNIIGWLDMLPRLHTLRLGGSQCVTNFLQSLHDLSSAHITGFTVAGEAHRPRSLLRVKELQLCLCDAPPPPQYKPIALQVCAWARGGLLEISSLHVQFSASAWDMERDEDEAPSVPRPFVFKFADTSGTPRPPTVCVYSRCCPVCLPAGSARERPLLASESTFGRGRDS